MCTNYTPPTRQALANAFGIDLAADYPSETYPDYLAPLIRRGEDGAREALLGTFGLVPKCKQPPGKHYATMNARLETVGEKPMYRTAWTKMHLCLIPCASIFEPNYETGRHVRYRIGMASGEPFAVAGLWRAWSGPGGLDYGFSMLTINADEHPVMRRFHKPGDEKRSVVIVPPADYDEWLACRSTEEARSMLRPCPPEQLVTEVAAKT